MATINVYEQYFAAEASFGEVERHAAAVLLIATSEEGRIQYEVAVNFFPHRNAEDFAISYDAYFPKTVYEAAGRRSRKREEQLLETLRAAADALAAEAGGTIHWDHPLMEARRG